MSGNMCVCILSLNKMRTSTIKMQFVQILEAAITVTATASGTKTRKLQVAGCYFYSCSCSGDLLQMPITF